MSDLLVSAFQTALLKDLSAKLGKSPNECLAEAIQDWVDIVAPARLEEVRQNNKSQNVVRFRKAG